MSYEAYFSDNLVEFFSPRLRAVNYRSLSWPEHSVGKWNPSNVKDFNRGVPSIVSFQIKKRKHARTTVICLGNIYFWSSHTRASATAVEASLVQKESGGMSR